MSIESPPHDVVGLDHVGIVVPDLEQAIEFYVRAFGAEVVSREADTDVDDVAIGLPDEQVRLRGAILRSGASQIELHQYLAPTGVSERRVCDQGIGHIAFCVSDIDAAYARLTNEGVVFNSDPNTITSGALEGRRWVYGRDPWGVVIELCQHPNRQNPTATDAVSTSTATGSSDIVVRLRAPEFDGLSKTLVVLPHDPVDAFVSWVAKPSATTIENLRGTAQDVSPDSSSPRTIVWVFPRTSTAEQQAAHEAATEALRGIVQSLCREMAGEWGPINGVAVGANDLDGVAAVMAFLASEGGAFTSGSTFVLTESGIVR